MRIARYVPTGSPDPAFGIVELAEDAGNFPDTVATITGDPLAGPVNYTGERLPLAQVRLLAPVIPRSKVVAVGKNYAAHAAEMGSEVPSAPILFLKPNTSVIGPDEAIIKPFEISELSYEAELAVVIGRICRRVPLERVPEVIFGYTCANDVTARDVQRAEQQWTRAKGWDTFCPLGPWIVTHLSVDEAQNVRVVSRVDGELRQDGNTNQMLWSIPELVSYVSNFTTLLPGDVILTGTPAGVGELRPLQHVTVGIDSIGELHNVVVAEAEEASGIDE